MIDYESGELLKKEYQLSKGNPIADTKEILARLKKYVTDQGASSRSWASAPPATRPTCCRSR